MKVCLVCLIGLPASGKTTFAKALCSCLCDKFIVEHFEYDKVVEWKSEVRWREERSKIVKEVSLLIESSLGQSNRLVVILDDNMYYRSMRYEFYKLARKYRVCYGQVYLKVDLERAILIDSKRKEGRVGEEVIVKMSNKLEAPSESWEENTLFLDEHTPFDSTTALEFILKTMERPVVSVELPVWEKEEPSMLHLADLSLRSIVGHLIKEVKTSNKTIDIKAFSGDLGKKRKEILGRIRLGEILIPKSVEEEKDYFEFLLPLFNN